MRKCVCSLFYWILLLLLLIIIVIIELLCTVVYSIFFYFLGFSHFVSKYVWIILFELNCKDFHYNKNKLLSYLLNVFFLPIARFLVWHFLHICTKYCLRHPAVFNLASSCFPVGVKGHCVHPIYQLCLIASNLLGQPKWQ